MSQVIQSFVQEFKQESIATRALLQAAPAEQYDFKPHEKSMSLGILAGHIADSPGNVIKMFEADTCDSSNMDFKPFVPASTEELLEKFEASLKTIEDITQTYDDAKATAIWTMVAGEKPIMSIPRFVAFRIMINNHAYHHRGQLSVYLRLLNVPVPSVYGPTADINPFA